MRQFTDMQERSALLAGASALRLRAGLITGASSNGMSVDEHAVQRGGEDYFERAYGVSYER